jgi:nicotinamidase-related amidase
MDARPNVHLVIVDPQNDFCDLPGAVLNRTCRCASRTFPDQVIDDVSNTSG